MTPELGSDVIKTPRTDALEERNQTDDVRQDLSDARQDRAEKKQARVSEDIVTLRDIYDIADSRMSRLETAMEKLVDTTNHRLEKFEEWTASIANILPTLATKKDLDDKADKDSLLTSWGERILRISPVRWVLGAALVALLTTAATQHWLIRAADWFEGFFS